MSWLLYLWLHGSTLCAQPFSYFGIMLSFSAFAFIVYVITALKLVLDNHNQHLLW